MAVIRAFRVTQHSQIFSLSLEIEFNALCFINYTIPRLCSSYAVATSDHVVAPGSSFISCTAPDKALGVRPPDFLIVESPWVVTPGAYLP